MRNLRLSIAFALLAGCGGDSAPELLEGFDPDPPAEDEIQILSPIMRDIAPGADVLLCTYLPLDQALAETVDVIGIKGMQSANAAHHAVLYTVNDQRPADTHECTDDDMVNISFSGAAGGGDTGGMQQLLPEGVAYRVAAGHQLMIQSHWINTTQSPIDGQSAFNLKVRAPSDDVELAQLFTWLTTDITVPAGATGSARTDCTIQEDMQFYQIAGHAHEHATNVRLLRTPTPDAPPEVIYDQSWAAWMTFDPPFLSYSRAEAVQIRAGETLSVECDYANPFDEDLIFPTEMCVGVGFFFPGTHQINCVNGEYDDR